jgi:hypothetical protein
MLEILIILIIGGGETLKGGSEVLEGGDDDE